MSRLLEYAAMALGLLVLSACDYFAHGTNEVLCVRVAAASSPASCPYNPDLGYRFDPKKAAGRQTLIVLTFSGGGIRAAALAYGTLDALQALPGTTKDGGRRLLDDVDIISSVSGGSVTAAWYALNGREGISDKQENRLLEFLHNEHAMRNLYWRGLNPVALARYAVTPYQRGDVLADFFSDRLYGDETYAEVEAKYLQHDNQPFVILNATDLGHETRFPFTQNRFDLICSDLTGYKVANAVAASADFPLVFSPIGLRNYSTDCPAYRDAEGKKAWEEHGPPHWIKHYARYDDSTDGPATDVPRSNGLAALRIAREAREYVEPRLDDIYLHLIDGGVVDNLGIQSTLALEDEAECAPGLFQRLKRPPPEFADPGAYDRIKEVVYVVVNARSRSPTEIDHRLYPPSLVRSFEGVVDTPIDNTILGTQNYLTSELHAIAAPDDPEHGQSHFVPERPRSRKHSCWTDFHYEKNATAAPPWPSQPAFVPRIVTIDFEAIPDPRCREKFWKIGTTWTLDKATIEQLITLPKVLLRRSGELWDVYHDLRRDPPDYDERGFPKDFAAVCADAKDP